MAVHLDSRLPDAPGFVTAAQWHRSFPHLCVARFTQHEGTTFYFYLDEVNIYNFPCKSNLYFSEYSYILFNNDCFRENLLEN